MNQLSNLKVEINKVTLTGYDVTFFKPSQEFQIVRKYPGKYSIRDTSWVLLDTMISSIGYCERTFRNRSIGKELNVSLPFWNSYPEWVALKDSNNEMLLILSSANWKRDENVYLGFIEVKI